ncbi:hypothetical protein GGI26_003423 [Coemansia sp. RSA 1358]|nr:hypothetical protein GGI26_003423 [Coemansia sp. RSA 1358]
MPNPTEKPAAAKRLFDPATGTHRPVEANRRPLAPAPHTRDLDERGSRGRANERARDPNESNGPANERTRGDRRRGKKERPKEIVVPRILVRPTNKTPVEEETPEQPAKPRPREPARPAEPAPQRAVVGHVPLISPSAKFLDTTARAMMGRLRTRLCIGILGRAQLGKSLILSGLSRMPPTRSRGLNVLVTPARIVLVDTPPVLNPYVDLWPRRTLTSKLAVAKAHDLQITLLLLQTCDTVVVVVGERKRRAKTETSLSEVYMDRGIARLLRAAAQLEVPGLGDQRCTLHIVINQGVDGQMLEVTPGATREIAHMYELETGIPVSNVSFLPTRAKKPRPMGVVEIADTWKSGLPLYPSADKHRAEETASLVSLQMDSGASFEQHMEEMRLMLMAPGMSARNEAEGAWVAGCLRAWDSIRRSNALLSAAADDVGL